MNGQVIGNISALADGYDGGDYLLAGPAGTARSPAPQFSRPDSVDNPILQRMAGIGLVPGRSWTRTFGADPRIFRTFVPYVQ
jgi:hypothetical protein